jgi:hypothetical protein
MWRGLVLLWLLSFGLCGCLDFLTRGDLSASTPQRVDTDSREADAPAPRLFRFEMDLPSE